VNPGYFWGTGMWLFPLIVIGVMFFMMSKRGTNSMGCHGSNEEQKDNTALDIIEKRYAKGEISDEEFTNMKKTLKHG